MGKIPWRRKQQPTPVVLPGESHGQRSLVGYSARGHTESDTTERLSTHAGAIVREFLCQGKWFCPLWLMALCREVTQRIRRARFCCWPLPLLAVRNCSLALQKPWLCCLQCECQLPVLSFLAKEKERTQGKEKEKWLSSGDFFM